MLFPSSELAARIERTECELLRDGVEPVRRRTGDAGFLTPIAGGLAAWTSPGSPFNKICGLGFGGAVDEAELEAVEAAYREHESPVQVELSNLADPAVARLLTGRGYRLVGFENVLGRTLPAPPPSPPPPGIEVRASPPEEIETWIDALVTGFATPDTQGVPSHEEIPRDVLEPIVRDFADSKGFERFVALRNGELAGAGSMSTRSGMTHLSGASTLPAHRLNGVQSALLNARLAAASERGSDLMVITTQPGSKSQQNAQRKGFELLYTRAVLVLETAEACGRSS